MTFQNRKGLTFVEVLVVLVIVALLMALLIPLIGNARTAAKVSSATQNLRQLHIAIGLYRAEQGASDTTFEDYYALGLPPASYVQQEFSEQHRSTLRSPCGENLGAFNSAMFPGAAGHASPVFATADPIYGPTQPKEFSQHFKDYRHNAVLFLDVNCNDANIDFRMHDVRKRGLAVLFSGQLINKFSVGNAAHLGWYTERSTPQ